jgi:cyclic pyranopterin phosphate synthase
MPLDANQDWRSDRVLTGEEMRAVIDAHYPLVAEPRRSHSTARVYRFADGRGRIGFVSPVSEPFCSDCNRLRITAEGKLRTCLFSLRETDLRKALRCGDGDGDGELEHLLREAVWHKELKHRINEPGFVRPVRAMSPIGG